MLLPLLLLLSSEFLLYFCTQKQDAMFPSEMLPNLIYSFIVWIKYFNLNHQFVTCEAQGSLGPNSKVPLTHAIS